MELRQAQRPLLGQGLEDVRRAGIEVGITTWNSCLQSTLHRLDHLPTYLKHQAW